MREKIHKVSLIGNVNLTNQNIEESFFVRWLKETSLENKLDICLVVIEEGCRNFQSNDYFKTEVEAVDCALQCIYLSTVTDRWSIMASILSKLPQLHGGWFNVYTNSLITMRCCNFNNFLVGDLLLANVSWGFTTIVERIKRKWVYRSLK